MKYRPSGLDPNGGRIVAPHLKTIASYFGLKFNYYPVVHDHGAAALIVTPFLQIKVSTVAVLAVSDT
jgi:hypothetical protein